METETSEVEIERDTDSIPKVAEDAHSTRINNEDLMTEDTCRTGSWVRGVEEANVSQRVPYDSSPVHAGLTEMVDEDSSKPALMGRVISSPSLTLASTGETAPVSQMGSLRDGSFRDNRLGQPNVTALDDQPDGELNPRIGPQGIQCSGQHQLTLPLWTQGPRFISESSPLHRELTH